MTQRAPVLTLHGIRAGYGERGASLALDGVDLDVHAGEHVFVLGPNGAGKSTLVRVASGTLAPISGEVLLLGKRLVDIPPRDRARLVAVVSQNESTALGFTVREVVALGRSPHQGPWLRESEEDRALVEDALRRCDLVGLAQRVVGELSGGEQKRVYFARALAQAPRLLLLDEPGAFLDVSHQLGVHDIVATAKAAGVACLSVVHDLNIAAQYADRVLLLRAGRPLALGSVPEVMTYKKLSDALDADLYCGVNDVTQDRFFVPMRRRGQARES